MGELVDDDYYAWQAPSHAQHASASQQLATLNKPCPSYALLAFYDWIAEWREHLIYFGFDQFLSGRVSR
jgi:hypothetical protein